MLWLEIVDLVVKLTRLAQVDEILVVKPLELLRSLKRLEQGNLYALPLP